MTWNDPRYANTLVPALKWSTVLGVFAENGAHKKASWMTNCSWERSYRWGRVDLHPQRAAKSFTRKVCFKAQWGSLIFVHFLGKGWFYIFTFFCRWKSDFIAKHGHCENLFGTSGFAPSFCLQGKKKKDILQWNRYPLLFGVDHMKVEVKTAKCWQFQMVQPNI